ncbi:hypothetical protein SBA1_820013 [Candidatus Sulfotelmatobacter kueseliae]|uniref:Uncharacterized protein n=1 Tax=Candidatus Sulfotelmatobacter kueseliae TaxID=2042962 RepID=A0A2U3L8G5_9BACT|nr:hypothetical protein SBA1_820013 [Candidatus Sulfotelmatobacter kueseliae]
MAGGPYGSRFQSRGVGVTSYGWQTLDSRRGPFGENRATVTVARLLVVFDQACQPVAASEAHAIVVERKVNVPPVGGDGVSGPVIESLLVPRQFSDHALWIARPILEGDWTSSAASFG